MKLTKRITFEAAHQLQGEAWKHSKCANVHGHTWHMEVSYEGDMHPDSMSVVDFSLIGELLKEVIFKRLDHTFINDVLKEKNATSEAIAVWAWKELAAHTPSFDVWLTEVKVQETESCWVSYVGN